MSDPLVSCLCSSVPSRWGLLQRAILDYCEQTYPNRELIIAVADPHYHANIRDWLYRQAAERVDIKVYHRTFRQHSEALLHLQAKAHGEYLAIWDDDNLNHPDRLLVQMGQQVKRPEAMTALDAAMYFFFETGELYFTNHQNPQGNAARRCAISTLIGHRDLWPDIKPQYRPHAVAAMANDFVTTKVKIATIGGLPFSHLVGVRGDNLRTEKVHRSLVTESPQARTRAWILERQAAIQASLANFSFDLATKVYAHGSDAEAFEYQPVQHWPDTLYPVGQPEDKITRVHDPR